MACGGLRCAALMGRVDWTGTARYGKAGTMSTHTSHNTVAWSLAGEPANTVPPSRRAGAAARNAEVT
ncbi:hypothetical protein Sme01_74870 [Sphaerisporangium melleum]|uniref:Uncharacterized protein n=1 Tax=Sphaerisporangium melleum TaxID=321316 RepID=A0A917RRS2_9ACTN|nr:hypothetical protein GCM10007964_74980 [Sphaerisporangium melleum]GII75011.1 hypothetical protein Sme01_74870 [Sphaerisporangium melleum]